MMSTSFDMYVHQGDKAKYPHFSILIDTINVKQNTKVDVSNDESVLLAERVKLMNNELILNCCHNILCREEMNQTKNIGSLAKHNFNAITKVFAISGACQVVTENASQSVLGVVKKDLLDEINDEDQKYFNEGLIWFEKEIEATLKSICLEMTDHYDADNSLNEKQKLIRCRAIDTIIASGKNDLKKKNSEIHLDTIKAWDLFVYLMTEMLKLAKVLKEVFGKYRGSLIPVKMKNMWQHNTCRMKAYTAKLNSMNFTLLSENYTAKHISACKDIRHRLLTTIEEHEYLLKDLRAQLESYHSFGEEFKKIADEYRTVQRDLSEKSKVMSTILEKSKISNTVS